MTGARLVTHENTGRSPRHDHLESPHPGGAPLPAGVPQRGREVAYRIAVDGSVLLRNRAQSCP